MTTYIDGWQSRVILDTLVDLVTLQVSANTIRSDHLSASITHLEREVKNNH